MFHQDCLQAFTETMLNDKWLRKCCKTFFFSNEKRCRQEQSDIINEIYTLGGVRWCKFVLQSAQNLINLKWQVVEYEVSDFKKAFLEVHAYIAKKYKAFCKDEVLACRFDTP